MNEILDALNLIFKTYGDLIFFGIMITATVFFVAYLRKSSINPNGNLVKPRKDKMDKLLEIINIQNEKMNNLENRMHDMAVASNLQPIEEPPKNRYKPKQPLKKKKAPNIMDCKPKRTRLKKTNRKS